MPAISDLLDSVVSATPAVSWSIRLTDTSTGDGAAHDPDRPLKTASVGKLVLLAEVARRIELDPAYGGRLLAREGVEPIADSGVLQHLSADSLAVGDLALLVGYASDNWATNLLLDEIGLDAVAGTGARLGLEHTVLLDRVRRPRMPADPPALSYGTGRELCDLMARLQRGDLLSPGVSERLNRWLATGVDLSMVASAFGFDPLSHAEDERGLRLVNKTGTDNGIRADVGHVRGPGGRAAYAVIANWPAEGPDLRGPVLASMRRIGEWVLGSVSADK